MIGANMNWKTWLLLFLALAAGSAASFCVKTVFFTERDAQNDAKTDDFTPKERLLVANGLLPAGTELNAQNVRLTLTSERDVPRDGVFTFEGIAGRKIARELKDGEPISLYDLESADENQADDSSFVPPGYVVVPIEICSASKATGGSNYLKTTKLDDVVKPGDVVDLVVVKEDVSSRAKRRTTSAPVVQDVSVFAVRDENRRTSDGVERSSILSALLSKEQVEVVRKASEEGKIKVVFHSTPDLSYEEQQEQNDFLNDGLYSLIKNNDAIFNRSTDDDSGKFPKTLNENYDDAGLVELNDNTSGDALTNDASTNDDGSKTGVFMNVSRKVEVVDSNDDFSMDKGESASNSDDVLSDSDVITGDDSLEGAEVVSSEETQVDDVNLQTISVDSSHLLDDADSEEDSEKVDETNFENENFENDKNSDAKSSVAPISALERDDNFERDDNDESQEVEKRPRVFSPFATRGSSAAHKGVNAFTNNSK